MKKIGKIIALISAISILCVSMIFNVSAATYDSSIDIGSSKNFKVGDVITAKITFKANDVGSVTGKVKYDTKVLQYTGCNANSSTPASSAAGMVTYTHAPSGAKNPSISMTFKVLSTGQSSIQVLALDEFLLYSDPTNPNHSMRGCTANFTATDKSATKSSNADLKTLTPSAGTLTPKFSPNVTTYSVTIPNSQTRLLLNYTLADSGATDKVEGSKDMKVGSNQRVIVVTAADGTVKKYTLNITRLAADGTAPEPEAPDTENPTDEKVSVTADGKDMYIAGSFDTANIFAGFSADVYTYNGAEFPSIKRDDTTLLYLTDTAGENGGFFRPLEDGTFTAFTYLETKSAFYEFLKADEVPEGYSEISIDIENQKVTAYQSSDPALTDFVLLWAKGPEGYTGFYRYDTTEQTIQRAVGAMYNGAPAVSEPDEEKKGGSIIENILALDTATKVIAIAIVGIILLLIVGIIVLIVKIARPSVYEEEVEDEDEDAEFEFVSVSNRDSADDDF